MTEENIKIAPANQSPSKFSPLKFLKWEASLALVVGALGFLFAIKTAARGWQIGAALLAFTPDRTLDNSTPLDSWVTPFPLFPLLAILLWLQGALTLFCLTKAGSEKPATSELLTKLKFAQSEKLLVGVGLAGALLIALVNRLSLLLPNAAGSLPTSDFDEMVYYQGSALIAQGHLPYRDFFLAHPPLVELIYGALLKLTPTNNAGGLASFLLLRWAAIGFGLLTVAGVFWAAGRLWAQSRFASGPGLAAAWLYAADARAAGVATLETPSNFFAIAGIICFLESYHTRQPRHSSGLLIASGALLTCATLCKLPGLAAIFAVVVLLLLQKNWRALLQLLIGLLGAGGLLLAPMALLVGPSEMLRQLFFFQLLRPQEVAAGKDQIGRLADFPQSALTVGGAGLGLLWLTYQLLHPRPLPAAPRYLLPVLWSAPLLFLLITNKSFHPWYFVQWAVPLVLLGGGLLTIRLPRPGLNLALALGGGLLALPLFWTQLAEAQRTPYDKVYLPTAAVLAPNQTVLAFDPGYIFMSAALPARLPATNKYLVDSAGYMVYLNLAMDSRSLGDLVQASLFGSRERGQERAIFERERAQAIIVEGLSRADWVALDVKLGLPQLTPRTVEFIGASASLQQQIEYVDLYRVRPLELRRVWQLSNGLLLTPFGLSTSLAGKANADVVSVGEVITIPAQTSPPRTLEIRLTWRVAQASPSPFKVFVHVLDSAGNKVAQRDIAPQDGQADLALWQPGAAFQDVHSLPLPALAPGSYRVELGFYEALSGARISINGQPALSLGTIVYSP